tara:strand:- start:434 stop:892 length:459 start_codon:yes stop_codon:yes gene_type:complete
MEFIEFLDKVEIEIIRMVEIAGYSIEENTPLCLLGNNYVGFLKKEQKTIVICTDNAKKREGYKLIRKINTDTFERTGRHIKKAIRHEAAHVAQECNNGKLLEINQSLSMNPAKIKALKGSRKISGEEEKEKQAYILEDKPKLLKKELEKYCL